MVNIIMVDEIWEYFLQVMLVMYQQEVLQYGMLLELVVDVNLVVLENNLQLYEQFVNVDELVCLNVECYGVICVGIVEELVMFCCMFVIMGMYFVSYYDFLQVGVLVYFMVFCFIDDVVLVCNLFWIFILLLCLELIENCVLCEWVEVIFVWCKIFIFCCLVLIVQYEVEGEFIFVDVCEFVQEVLEMFCWYW